MDAFRYFLYIYIILFFVKGYRGIHWQKLMRNRRFTVAECVEVIILVRVVQHVIQYCEDWL